MYEKKLMRNKVRKVDLEPGRKKIYKYMYNQENISDKDVLIEFKTDADANTYSVVKLWTIVDAPTGTNVTKLPYYFKDKRNPIIWLTSFRITHKKTKKPLTNFEYSVLFNVQDIPEITNGTHQFVYHDGENLHPIDFEESVSFLKIRLNQGDPSVGITRT